MNFYKMTALGNDYIFFNDLYQQNLVEKIRPMIPKISDRHFGIGGDGVIIIEPSSIADCRMRMFNSDGSEATMCGNGIRQMAKLIWDKHWISKNPMQIETLAGTMIVSMEIENDLMLDACVNMGEMSLDATKIPCTATEKKGDVTVFTRSFEGKEYLFYTGVLGSKHCVSYIDSDIKTFDFCRFGKEIEQDRQLFPDGVNVEFVQIINKNKGIMRVWERGTGHTLACGTGATFSAAMGAYLGFFDSTKEIEIELEKGSLYISHEDKNIFMRGGAEFIFEGSIDI